MSKFFNRKTARYQYLKKPKKIHAVSSLVYNNPIYPDQPACRQAIEGEDKAKQTSNVEEVDCKICIKLLTKEKPPFTRRYK